MIALGFAALMMVAALGDSQASASPAPAEQRPSFSIEEVKVRSGDALLAGSLYLPAGPGPHPAVVLIHGSGPQTRGWPYEVHARDFAARGIATLTYDKRGSGASTGTYTGVDDLAQLANDASGTVAHLAADRRIRSDRIGVWGRSQGAWIAPMVAAKSPNVAFAMLIVGGGVSVPEQNLYAARRRLEQSGYSADEIGTILKAQRAVSDYLRTGEGFEEAKLLFDGIAADPRLAKAPNDILNRMSQLPSPQWVRENRDGVLRPLQHMNFDPAPYLARLDIPSLAILASEDVLTPTSETAAVLNRAFARRPDSKVIVLPGADHTLCPAVPGKDFQLNCRFVDGYESAMGDWLERVSK